MKKMKKFLALALIGTMCMGTALTANAAELDTAWYAAKNPDVVAVMGNSPEAMKLHYEVFGKYEHRMANPNDIEAQLRRLFNAKEYAALYPDIKAVFGDNEEAMFNHYISYGLLERRRPSEKVSQDAAVTLRNAVAEALTKAGLDATPGSGQLAAIITDTIPATAAAQAVQTAMKQTQPTIEKAVEAAAAPAPTGGSGGGGGSSSSSSSNSSSSSGSAEEATATYVIKSVGLKVEQSTLWPIATVTLGQDDFVALADTTKSIDSSILKKIEDAAEQQISSDVLGTKIEIKGTVNGEEDHAITKLPEGCWKIEASDNTNQYIYLRGGQQGQEGTSEAHMLMTLKLDTSGFEAAGYTEELSDKTLWNMVTQNGFTVDVIVSSSFSVDDMAHAMHTKTSGSGEFTISTDGGKELHKKVLVDGSNGGLWYNHKATVTE